MVDEAVLLDRAMRNARVLARRTSTAVEDEHVRARAGRRAGRGAPGRPTTWPRRLGSGRDARGVRARLTDVAATLDPFVVAPDDWQAQSLVLLLRSLVVDLLEMAGAGPGEAREALPEI